MLKRLFFRFKKTFLALQLFTLREQQSKSRHSSGSTEETMKLMSKNDHKDEVRPEHLPKVWLI